MNTLYRKIGLLATALILAAMLILMGGSQRLVIAGCGADVTWQISSESDFRETSDTQNGRTVNTQDVSHRVELHSDNGQDSTHTETYHRNADGSSHYHGEFNTSDLEGKGCYDDADGTTWRGDNTQDKDTDSKGHTKEHIEEIIERHGKCEKAVRDREWDAKGNLIKDTGWVRTEIPCSKYNLEVSMKGSISLPGLAEIKYGPNKAIVHLEKTGDRSYAGKYEGRFDVEASGKCSGSGVYPVAFDVTATEDEFEDLDFIVKISMDLSYTGQCEGKSHSANRSLTTNTQVPFTLPAKDGATLVFNAPTGNLSWTYTLREKK